MEPRPVRNGPELGSRMTTLHKSDQSLLCQTTLSFVIPTGAQRRDLQCTLPVITLHRNIGVTTLSFVIPSEAEGSAVRLSR